MRRGVLAWVVGVVLVVAAGAQAADVTDALSEAVGVTVRVATETGGDRRSLYQDAAANRLIVMPTGFPMERGEFHVTDQEIIIVTASYGLTDYLTLWGGVSIPGMVLSGRLSVTPTPSVGLSAGAFLGVEWFEGYTLVLPYALASFGSPEHNATVGGAGIFTLWPREEVGYSGAVLAIGGRTVLTPTAALVGEMWTIWPKPDGIRPAAVPLVFTPAGVFRIAGNRLSWDLGAVVPLFLRYYEGDGFSLGGVGDDTVIPIPIVSVTYRID